MRRRIVFVIPAILVLSLFVGPSGSWVYPDCTEDESFEKFGPRADRLLIGLYPDDIAEFLALEAGEIDIVDCPLTREFKEKWQEPPYNETIKQVSYGTDLSMYVLDINNNGTQPDGTPNPTRESELRHAIAHCVDKECIVDECLGGQGCELWALIGPVWPDYSHPEIRPGGALEDLCHLFNCTEARRIVDNSSIFRFVSGPGVRGIQSVHGDHLQWHPAETCIWEDVVLKFVITNDTFSRTCSGDMIADELENCLGIQVNRVYSCSSDAYVEVMVEKHFNLYTGCWKLSEDPDWLVLCNIRYYWHPGFCPNYCHVNCTDYNYWTDVVESPNTVEEAIEAAMRAQEAMAAEDCIGVIPLFAVEGVMAHRRCYSGGTGGDPVTPDDGENQYRCQKWGGIVNPPGEGITSWWSMLNMHPEGHPMGDSEHMIIRWGFRVPDHRNLNPVYSPSTSSGSPDWNVLNLIYGSLIVRDPYHPQSFIPYIAKNWTVGTWEDPESGATYSKVRFTLRTDITWHDGYRLTVEDVKFTLVDLTKMLIERGCPPPSWYQNVAFVRDCYIFDPCNIEILLETKSVWALGWLGTNIILPKHIWKPLVQSIQWPGKKGPHTCEDIQGFSPDYFLIGSGPWRFVEYVMGSHDLLLANKPSSIITDTIGTDKEFADVHPFKPGDEVHSHCGYFQWSPVYVDVHTCYPPEYEWRQRFPPPCTGEWCGARRKPVYFKLKQHCLWKNKVPNTATGEDLGMLIADKVVKLEVHECQTVTFPGPRGIHFKNDTWIRFPCGARLLVGDQYEQHYEEYPSSAEVLFNNCTVIKFVAPTQIHFLNATKVNKTIHLHFLDPILAHSPNCHWNATVNGEEPTTYRPSVQVLIENCTQVEIEPNCSLDFSGGSWVQFQEYTTVRFPEDSWILPAPFTTPELIPAKTIRFFDPSEEIIMLEDNRIHFLDPEVCIGIREESDEKEYCCKPLVELLGPFHFSRRYYKLIVFVHVKGPENITVTEDGDIIEVPNPWVCQNITDTYQFWSTLINDIAGATLEDDPDYCIRYDIYTKEQMAIPDCLVDITDVAKAARAFGAFPGHPRWDVVADINYDHIIDISDLADVCRRFGWGA